MAQVLEIEREIPREVYIDATQKKPPQIQSLRLDDPLVALERPRGPYTIDNADEYLDTEPVELYNGWLVRQEMSDINEKRFEGRLHLHLGSTSSLLEFGDVLPDQMECHLSDGNVIKPDLSLISWERLRQRVQPHGPNDRPTLMGSPELVVEVRSPSNRRAQDKSKRKRYFDNGAEIIWDIDEKKQIIYVYRADSQNIPDVYTADDEVDCEPLLPGWRRRVSALFEEQAPVEVVFSEVHEDGKEIGREEGEKIGEQRGKEIGREEGEKVGREEGEKIGEQRGKQIGREEGEKIGEKRGREEGEIRRSQDMLIRLLQARFPDLSEQTLDIIKQSQDIAQLDNWFNQALMAQSLDELSF